jgi:hypothetical protein
MNAAIPRGLVSRDFFQRDRIYKFRQRLSQNGEYLDVKNRQRRIVRMVNVEPESFERESSGCELSGPESFERESSGCELSGPGSFERESLLVRFCMRFSTHGRRKQGMVMDFV